jgi:hypothetical protein
MQCLQPCRELFGIAQPGLRIGPEFGAQPLRDFVDIRTIEEQPECLGTLGAEQEEVPGGTVECKAPGVQLPFGGGFRETF